VSHHHREIQTTEKLRPKVTLALTNTLGTHQQHIRNTGHHREAAPKGNA
jgi:hypothetical protein